MSDGTGRRIVGTIRTEDDIPKQFASNEAEAEFWDTHEFSREFLRAHRIPREQSPYVQLKAQWEAKAREPEAAP